MQVEDAGGKIRKAFEPAIVTASSIFTPLKDHLPSLQAEPGLSDSENNLSELARRLKVKLQG